MGLGVLLRAATRTGAEELVDLHRRTVAPLPVRRRIGMVALAGGAGCSTTARQIADVLDARRSTSVLSVHIDDGSPRVAAGGPAPHVVPSTPDGPDIDAWRSMVQAATETDLVVTDWGPVPLARLRDVAAHSHALCLVAEASRASLQHATDAAVAIGDDAPVVVAVVDVRGIARTANRVLQHHMPVPAHFVPHDRRLPLGTTRIPPAPNARLSLLRIAADLITLTSTAGRVA